MKHTKIIKKNYEFKNIFVKGKYFQSNNIEAFIKKNNKDEKYNYLGVAISVKVGKAVRRNQIKRLIKEVYRNIEEEIMPGYSFVFLWKKTTDTKNARYDNIKKDISIILKKAGVLI